MTRRSLAKKLGLKIHGRVVAFAAAEVPPEIMGIGPAVAIPAALSKAGLGINDIDIYEINEAFASQATYSIKKLNIPMEKVNPRGGALALGHPLGCTGARQVVTLFNELERTGKRYGVISMCIGTGMWCRWSLRKRMIIAKNDNLFLSFKYLKIHMNYFIEPLYL